MAKIILLSKQDRFSQQAIDIARTLFGDDMQHFTGCVGDPMPALGDADFLISFLSPWIVPKEVLDRYPVAINFHPGSVDYPGTGCYNFALYEGAAEFGATCHHMLPKVDTGIVVLERRFPTFPADTVEALKLRTMVTMVSMFHDVACMIAEGRELPVAETHWTRKAFTRKQMNALKEVLPTMSKAEIERRVRASTYPGYPGAFMVDGGRTVHFPVPDRAPLA